MLIHGIMNLSEILETFPVLAGSEQFSDNVNKNCKYYADDNHAGYGKIKSVVFPLNLDVARQFTKPVQLVGKKIYHDAGD